MQQYTNTNQTAAAVPDEHSKSNNSFGIDNLGRNESSMNKKEICSDLVVCPHIIQSSLQISHNDQLVCTQAPMAASTRINRSPKNHEVMSASISINQSPENHEDIEDQNIWTIYTEEYSECLTSTNEMITDSKEASSQIRDQFLCANPINLYNTIKNCVANFSQRHERNFKAKITVENLASKLNGSSSRKRGSGIVGQLASMIAEKSIIKRDQHTTDFDMHESFQQNMIEQCSQIAQLYMDQKNVGLKEVSRGIIVPLKGGNVLPIVRILNNLFGLASINKRKPKVAIITDKGTRADQIHESCNENQSQEARFMITKDYLTKDQNITQQQIQDQKSKFFKENDVFIFKSRNFHESLIRADFKIYDFDIIMFDDVHSRQLPDHPYNRVMSEFYYQNQNAEQLLSPLIIGLANFDNVFQETDSKSQITNRLMCYSNMLNANLAVLSESQAIRIMSDVCSDTNKIRWQFFKPSSILNTIKDALQFITSMNNNLVVGNQAWAQGTQICPHQDIFQLKNKDSSIVSFQTKVGSKLTTKDAKRIFSDFQATLNKHVLSLQDQIIASPFTVRMENVQFVCPSSKIRYFSSRLQLDQTISTFLGLKKEQSWFYSNDSDEQSKNKILSEGAVGTQKLFLFKKRLESEDYIYLQLCQVLHSNGFITDYLGPNEPGIIQCLTQKFEKIIPKPLFIAETATKSFKQVDEHKSSSSLKESRENFKKIVGELNEYCDREILQKASDLAQAQLEYNCEKIKFFIRQILNPIMHAVFQYEQRIMTEQRNLQQSDDAISWVKFDRVQSDQSQMKVKQIRSINQKFLSYAKEIFQVSESRSLDSSKEFMEIVKSIHPCVEQLQMTTLVDVDFTEKEHLINRTCLAIMLTVAMTPKTSDHIIKEELKRMALVGHQAINTAVVLNHYLKYQGSLTDKDLEKHRLNSLTSSNLKKKGSEFCIKLLLLKNHERETEARETQQVIECFAGLFEIFTCFSSTYLFMHDLGLIESSLDCSNERIGENSSDYKQKVLEEVSSQYSQIMQIENQVKTEIYSQMIDTNRSSHAQIPSHKASYQQALIAKLIEGNKKINKDEKNISVFDEEIKQQQVPYKQPQDEISANSKIEEFNRTGYIHKCKSILMQCFTDKSYSEYLAQNSEGRIDLSTQSLLMIQMQREKLGYEQIDSQSMIKEAILQFNNKKFAQLGNSLMTQTLAKHLYIETFNEQDFQLFRYHNMCQLLTKSTSKEWLGYLLSEKFFDMMFQQARDNQHPQEKLHDLGFNEDGSSQLISQLPSVPILLDDSNIKLKENVARYQQTVYRQCLEHFHRNNNSDCEELKGYEEPNRVNKNFNQQQDHFVEVFSDTMSALIAGILFDSGDFQITQQQILGLLRSRIYGDNPFVDQERAKVIEVWNSKKYTEGLEITHVIEEKDDFVYIRVYFGKLEVRRCKFEKQKVNKVSKTYLDLRFYLENAYKQFEAKWWPKKYNIKETQVRQDHWVSFNQEYRKQYHPNKAAEILRRQYSLFKEACKQLSTDHFDINTSAQIIEAFTKGGRMQHISPDSILLVLEDERSSSSKIREMFNNCGIYQINTLSEKNKDLKSWVNNLSEYNLERLYEEMERFQSLISNDLVHDDEFDTESGSMASTKCHTIHF